MLALYLSSVNYSFWSATFLAPNVVCSFLLAKLGKYLGIISLLCDSLRVYILEGCVPKKRKNGEEKRQQKRQVRRVKSWKARTRTRMREENYSLLGQNVVSLIGNYRRVQTYVSIESMLLRSGLVV